MARMLRIYIADDCRGCEIARATARDLQARVTGVDVQVLDIADHPPPPQVFSVPTYLLDDVVISLGNPTLNQLIEWLSG